MSSDRQLLEKLCDLEVANVIKISPDTKRILYSTQLTWGHRKGKNIVSTLWLASTGQPNSSRRILPGSFNDHAPVWHPSGKSLAFISDRASPGKKWAIYSLPIEGPDEAVEAITPPEHESPISSFAFSPSGQYIVFLATDEKTVEETRREVEGEDVLVWGKQWKHSRLRVLNMSTGQIRTLALDRHITSVCWSADEKQLGFVSCATSDEEEPFVTGSTISIVDIALTTCKDLCQFSSRVGDLTWAKDGRLYFWSGYPQGDMFSGFGVYAIDSQSKSLECEKVGFGEEDDVWGIMQLNGEIVVKLEHRLESRVSLLSGEVLYERREALEAFDAACVPGSDDTVIAFSTSNINKPVEVFTTTVGGQTMVQLSSHGSTLEDRVFGQCNYLSFSSSDGKEEVDSLYLTPGTASVQTDKHVESFRKPSSPLPTVVLIHGGPNTRITNAFNTYYYMITPYLLSLGYGVLLPNYRGSTGRGEKYGRYSVGGIGNYDYADIIMATQNAIDLGFADKERLVVGGWSQGGFLTLLCSVRNGLHGHGWRFKASIPGASIADIDSMALTSDFASCFEPQIHEGRVVWNMDTTDTRNRLGSPLWQFNEAMEHSKRTKEMVVPPMLILHGENDLRCHVSNAWALRRALESRNLPFEMALYPRQGHMFHEQKFWIDMNLRLARWCDKYIGKGISTVS